MKSITLLHRDYTQRFVMLVPKSFDTQAWANARVASFALLQVVRVIENEC